MKKNIVISFIYLGGGTTVNKNLLKKYRDKHLVSKTIRLTEVNLEITET